MTDPKSGKFKVKFWYKGRQVKWSLKHDNEVLANETLTRVERTLRDLEEGRLVLPEGGDLVEFVKSDGGRVVALQAPEKPLTLGELFKLYPEKIRALNGEVEHKGGTLYTNEVHGRHLIRILGAERTLTSLTATGALQEYVNSRAKQKSRRTRPSRNGRSSWSCPPSAPSGGGHIRTA